MKKMYFLFVALVVSVTMFAADATFFFSGKGSNGESCALTKVVVENLTRGWTETLTGPQFSIVMKEHGQGFESVYADNGALTMAGANPCYGVTQLNLNLEKSGNVNVYLFDISGRLVCSKSDLMAEGNYTLNVSMPTPQMYYLKVETAQGSYNAKLLNMGVGFAGGISVSKSGVNRITAKVASDLEYGVGDNIKFTGYTAYDNQEYSNVKSLAVTRGMTEIISFTFALPQKPVEQDTASLYLGIIGFNDALMTYPITKMSKSEAQKCKNFIDGFRTKVGTLLYHADWNALDMLQAFWPPKDLANATLITFTDGLDLASHQQTSTDLFFYDEDNTRYRDSVHYRIMNDKVAGLNVTAYAIGIRGNDVNTPRKIEQFEQNLPLLANDAANAYQVSDMSAVNQKFDSIAQNLNKVNTRSDLSIIAVARNSNTRISWTLDLDTALVSEWNNDVPGVAKSHKYISAKYWRKNGISFLTDIQYDGLTCVTQDTIWGDMNYKTTFVFNDIRDENGDAITAFPMIYEWVREDETENWTLQSEFERDNNIKPIPQNSSAVIMLVLDCSSSLGETGLEEIKNAAKNFIDIITVDLKDDETSPQIDNTKYCWEVTHKYEGASQTSYVWATESEVKSLRNSFGATNFSYRKASASDEYSCEALNLPAQETPYYIKHPWGTGQDADWAWKKMTKEGNNYVYSGKWGGVGANINTTASDTGADWYSQSDISGASSLSIGDNVKFTYNPSYGTLSVTKTSSGSGSTAKVRFQKTDAYERVLAMAIDQKVGGEWNTLAFYEFGTAAGTTSYYDIASGSLYPTYYYQADTDEDSGWYYVYNDPYTYSFIAGKKYTFVCTDDGSYLDFHITTDGSFGAPAKVVASTRILKSELTKRPKVRR